jgi:Galactose oxidase, central domain
MTETLRTDAISVSRPARGAIHRRAGRGWAAFRVAAAVVLLMASGCGGGGSSQTSITLSGTVVQGPMGGATVTAFAVDTTNGMNGLALGTATTDTDGSFTLRLSPAFLGPMRLTASGGSFVSEMNGVGIKSPSAISALIESPATTPSGISINPLSEFVSSLTIGNLTVSGATFSAALAAATKTIEHDYALFFDPATIVPDYTAARIGTDGGNLGLALGALINEDQYLCPAAPGGLVAALSADIQDGVFDGTKFGAAIPYCGGVLSAIAGISQFQDALSGLQQLASVTQAFDFGGTGNVLTINGVADVALDGTEIYPSAPPIAIDMALANAAPPPVNEFAKPQTAVMNTARQKAVAVELKSGQLLIAGGLQPATLASTDLYNPASNSFADPQNATMSSARAYATGTLLPNGNVLIAGGTAKLPLALRTSDLYLTPLNCFAGEIGTLCASHPSPPLMNDGRQLATANLLPNGKVLIAAGNDGFGNVNSCELYDPVNNCFAGNPGTPCASLTPPFMNRARDVATATLLPNGKVLVAGGFSGPDAVASTELYDSTQNCFAGMTGTPCQSQTAPAMKVARFLASAVLLPDGNVLIAGGFNVTNGVLASTELYDPVNNCFAGNPKTACAAVKTPTMNIARQGATITLLPNGKVLIAGGSDNTGASLASTELYDPANNCFAGNPGTPCAGQIAPAMNVARQNDAAVLLVNGKVLLAGSGDGHTALASTDLYTP